MSSLKELKGEHIQTRSIIIKSYDAGEGRLVVEGTLNDDRATDVYTAEGNHFPPGPVHGMVLRFLIGGMPPKILDAEAEMPTVPMDECPDAMVSVKDLVGLNIAYGFSKEVRNRMGKTKGCLHMTNLALAMASPCLQGWANAGRRKPGQTKTGAFFC